MSEHAFTQVDVFAPRALTGNPVAVVHDADEVTDARMAAFANWTNLSETTFLLPPTAEGAAGGADYRVRIWTPSRELPFAGHPTLGTAHAWLEAGGVPARDGVVVQECGVGLVEVRRGGGAAGGAAGGAGDEAVAGGELAFAAPALLRSGPVDAADREQAVAALGVDPAAVIDLAWVDNGPGWLGVRLDSAATVLGLRPDMAVMGDLRIGVVGPHELGGPADVEVRAFVPVLAVAEDPVTGSLNAGLALWLTADGTLPPSYVARQGTALGRDGRVSVTTGDDGRIWVGGATRSTVRGTVEL